jgi:hypothetical protein
VIVSPPATVVTESCVVADARVAPDPGCPFTDAKSACGTFPLPAVPSNVHDSVTSVCALPPLTTKLIGPIEKGTQVTVKSVDVSTTAAPPPDGGTGDAGSPGMIAETANVGTLAPSPPRNAIVSPSASETGAGKSTTGYPKPP